MLEFENKKVKSEEQELINVLTFLFESKQMTVEILQNDSNILLKMEDIKIFLTNIEKKVDCFLIINSDSKKVKINVSDISEQHFIDLFILNQLSLDFNMLFKKAMFSLHKTLKENSLQDYIQEKLSGKIIKAKVIRRVPKAIFLEINFEKQILSGVLENEETNIFSIGEEIDVMLKWVKYIDGNYLLYCDRDSEVFVKQFFKTIIPACANNSISIYKVVRRKNIGMKIVIKSDLPDYIALKEFKGDLNLNLLKIRTQFQERIHVIVYNQDLKQFVLNMFDTHDVHDIVLEDDLIKVFVNSEALQGKYIGKKGENVHALSQLLKDRAKVITILCKE